MKEYQNHPLAELFPPLSDAELKRLSDDIKLNGLHKPITLFNGEILDGRNRYNACKLANVEPTYHEYTGDPLAFVMSSNLYRRHLNVSQRAIIAARLTTGSHGGDRISEQGVKKSLAQITEQVAAALLSISESSVQQAKKLLKEMPEKAASVESGEETLSSVLKSEKKSFSKAPSPAERERFRILEERITKSLKGLKEMSFAFKTIRDSQLWRSEYKSLNDFCQAECGLNETEMHEEIEFIDSNY
jgi:hypothetical protein